MTFHVRTASRVKLVAKSLSAHLTSAGHDGYPYSRCLELVAKMYGHAGYAALSRSIGTFPPSADDVACPPEVAAARRSAQIAVLVKDGLSGPVAADAIDAVRPTGRADPAKRGEALLKRVRAAGEGFEQGRKEMFERLHAQRDLLSSRARHAGIDVWLARSPLVALFDRFCAVRPPFVIADLMRLHRAGTSLDDFAAALAYWTACHAASDCDMNDELEDMGMSGLTEAQYVAIEAVLRENFPDGQEAYRRIDHFDYDEFGLAEFAIGVMRREGIDTFRLLFERIREWLGLAAASGATIGDLAASISAKVGLEPEGRIALRKADTLRQATLTSVALVEGRRRRVPKQSAAELLWDAIGRAREAGIDGDLAEALGRGQAKGLADVALPRPRGRAAMLVDALCAAEIAGLTSADLARATMAASIMEAEVALQAGVDVVQMDPSLQETVDAVGELLGPGSADPELAAAAVALGLTRLERRRFAGDRAFIELVHKLARSRIPLSDIAALAVLPDLVGRAERKAA